MKGNLLIIFKDKYGYEKRYVDIIGNAVGCDAVPVDKLSSYMLGGYDKIMFVAPISAYRLDSFKKLDKYMDSIYKKLIILGVGVPLFADYIPQRIKEANLGVLYEKFVPVFYAQGGFDFNELTRMDKMVASMTVKNIKASATISAEDTFLINAINTPFDAVSKENVRPLIDFLEDRPVSEDKYSPAEITDPEEEKKFFEELEAASKEPVGSAEKKRALKKKLKS